MLYGRLCLTDKGKGKVAYRGLPWQNFCIRPSYLSNFDAPAPTYTTAPLTRGGGCKGLDPLRKRAHAAHAACYDEKGVLLPEKQTPD